MNQIKFRPATPQDLPVLLEFEQGIIAAERPFDPTLADGHFHYYDLAAYIRSADTEVLVAEIDGSLIGSGYIQIRPGKPYHKHAYLGYIGFIYVRPAYRGQGVVGGILSRLISWAKSKDIIEVRLDVYAQNDAAIRAYEKAGFSKNLIEMRIDVS